MRFIGNFSTGKMGFAIAEELAKQGAEVILVAGPTNQEKTHSQIKRIDIQSADEMYEACTKHFPEMDGAILSAAVADYKPATQAEHKIKRKSAELTIELTANKDIAKALGSAKTSNQIVVGFALETDNEIENAKRKIVSKNLDFIVLNSLKEQGAGFGFNTNKISIVDNNNNIINFELKQKNDVAKDIVTHLISFI